LNLNTYEIRIIIDALEFKLAQMKKNQDMLDDSEQDKIAELSNDIYYLELLIDRLKDEYKNRVQKIEDQYQENFNEIEHIESELV
jgi:predicted  nucleic acid-binding Zn-ribbon protein